MIRSSQGAFGGMGTINQAEDSLQSYDTITNQNNKQVMVEDNSSNNINNTSISMNEDQKQFIPEDQRCSSQFDIQNNSFQSYSQPPAFRTKKKMKNLRLSINNAANELQGGVVKTSQRQNTGTGIVLKSDQIKRIYTQNQQQKALLNQSFQQSLFSPTNPQRNSIQLQSKQLSYNANQQQTYPNNFMDNLTFNSSSTNNQFSKLNQPMPNANYSTRLSQQNLVNQQIPQIMRAENYSNISQPASLPMGRSQSRGAMIREITVRSKTPTDSYSMNKKDLYKNLQIMTLGNNEPYAESLSATKKFFKELKSSSITKIMSPSNINTDTA